MNNFKSLLAAALLLGSASLTACGDDSGTGGAGTGGDATASTGGTTTGSPTSTTTTTGSPTSTSSGQGDGGSGAGTGDGGAGGGTGGGTGGSGGDPFVFADNAYDEYDQIDRHGAVEAGTAGILAQDGLGIFPDDGPLDLRDDYNASNPEDDIASVWVPDLVDSVVYFQNLNGDISDAGFTPATIANVQAQALPVIVPDTIKYDPDQPTSYPNGRGLEDRVVDITLAAVLLQWGEGVGPNGEDQGPTSFFDVLNPAANDVEFDAAFPYLAPPHD